MTLLHLAKTLSIQSAVNIGIVGINGKQCISLFKHIQDAIDVPSWIFIKRIGRSVLQTDAQHFFVAPNHIDETRASCISRFGYLMDERPSRGRNATGSGVRYDQALT